MSEPKIPFQAPVPRDPSSAREIVPVQSTSVQLARPRIGPRPVGTSVQAGGSQFVLHALRRWWKIAFPVGLLLACGAVGAVYLFFEPKYEASALLEIEERAPYIAYEPKEAGISKGYFRTQMDKIHSRWIIGRAKEALGEKSNQLAEIFKRPDPIDWLRKQVTVTAGESDLFEIKYSSAIPANAVLVVNTVTEQYLKAQEEEDTARNIQIVDALGKQMSAREEGVRALRKQVLTKTQEVEGKEPEAVRPDPGSPNKNPLGELQSRLIDLQVQKALLSAQIQASEEELAAAEKATAADGGTVTGSSADVADKTAASLSVKQPKLQDDAIRTAVADSPDIRALKSHLVSAQAELQRIEKRSTKGKKDPFYIRQQEEIAIIAQSIKQQEKKIADETPLKMKLAAAPLSKEEIELRDALVKKALAENSEVQRLNTQLLGSQMELDRIERRFKKGKADLLYIRQKEESEIFEKNITALKERLKEQIQDELTISVRAKRGNGGIGVNSDIMILSKRREELARMRNTLRGYELAEAKLREEYHSKLETFLKQLKNVSEESVELTFKKDELKEKEGVLARIAERQIALQTERSAPTRVILHEKARAPEAPVELLPYRNMALAGLLAMCLPFALAVGWEGMARRIGGSEDLEHQLHLAVLGEISRLPTRIRGISGSTGTQLSMGLRIFQECIDNLRIALTLSDDLRDMRILAITSAVNHEGKTSVASQLALSLARSTGKKTLLIDGDMRSPDVHQVFGVPQGPGLAEVLSHECPLADAIVNTHNEHVHVLPAGELKVSPHQLLGNGSLKSLLEQIPKSYGYVIIDTPPVLAASEALVLAKAADASLLCVMRDVSRADQVRKAAERLLIAGGRPVGTVLSGVPMSRNKYSYGIYPLPSNS